MLRKELRNFLNALMFFTRIPCPSQKDFKEEHLNDACRYFSAVGILVGAIGFVAYYGASYIVSPVAAIIISLIITAMTTGGFHEDGLADTIDGFGGGWTKEKILTIMKDSRVGAFGALGLILLIMLKVALLADLLPMATTWQTAALFLTAHALSRAASSTLLITLQYVQEDKLSKAKPLAQKISPISFCLLLIFDCSPLFLFLPEWRFFYVIAPPFATALILGSYYKKRLGGYTGDCLGAAQQLAEVSILIGFSALMRHAL